jgi:hypothetical protein
LSLDCRNHPGRASSSLLIDLLSLSRPNQDVLMKLGPLLPADHSISPEQTFSVGRVNIANSI